MLMERFQLSLQALASQAGRAVPRRNAGAFPKNAPAVVRSSWIS